MNVVFVFLCCQHSVNKSTLSSMAESCSYRGRKTYYSWRNVCKINDWEFYWFVWHFSDSGSESDSDSSEWEDKTIVSALGSGRDTSDDDNNSIQNLRRHISQNRKIYYLSTFADNSGVKNPRINKLFRSSRISRRVLKHSVTKVICKVAAHKDEFLIKYYTLRKYRELYKAFIKFKFNKALRDFIWAFKMFSSTKH